MSSIAAVPPAVPLDAVFALADEGLAYVGATAEIVAWNEPAANLTGVAAEVAIGSDVRRLFRGGDRIVAVPFDGCAHAVRLGPQNGALDVTIRASVVALNLDAQTHGWLCSFGPERRHRAIEQLKSEIVTAVSHELKTPIATIKAFAETLLENPAATEDERTDYLRVIEEQTDRLARSVDDLLLASRVDSEHLLRRRVETPVDHLIDNALASLHFDAVAHPVERNTAGVTISGDPDLLTEVLRQLFDNAAKFSPPGCPITIDAQSSGRTTHVTIRDRGVGIPEEHLPHVFERFYRVERDLTAPAGGSGLGLFIVAALTRAHGGSIGIQSAAGGGSIVSLAFPTRLR